LFALFGSAAVPAPLYLVYVSSLRCDTACERARALGLLSFN
jgi:hypothetical protein